MNGTQNIIPNKQNVKSKYAYADIQKVLSDGVQLNADKLSCCFFKDFLVYLMRGEDPITTKSGPPSARQPNGISMAFLWRANDDPTLNAGLVALYFPRDPDQYC